MSLITISCISQQIGQIEEMLFHLKFFEIVSKVKGFDLVQSFEFVFVRDVEVFAEGVGE